MALTVPNAADATFTDQAELDSRDVDIIVAGFNTTGVESGCVVASTGTTNGSVTVAAGTVRIAGRKVVVAAQTVALTANASGNPRNDLITINTSGTAAGVAGTAATDPAFPTIPASRVVLAVVRAANGFTTSSTIAATAITDKRVVISPSNTEDARTYGAAGDAVSFVGSITTGTAALTSQLVTPTGASATPSTAGGTLAAATYGYRVSAVNAFGETLACTTVTAVTTGSTGSVALAWTAVVGAVAYRVYGRVSGSEAFMTQIASWYTSWTDVGASSAGGALPGTNTTGPFTAAMVGKAIYLSKAGAASAQYVGTVLSYTNSTAVTLAANASTTATNVKGTIGTDDSTAVGNAIAALTSGSTLYFPNGNYLCSGIFITGKSNLTVTGDYATVSSYTETSAVIQVYNGSQIGVQGLRVNHASTTARNGGGFGIQAKYCQDVTIQGNFIFETCAAGVYLDGVARGTALANTVYRNLADGIHTTNGSSDIDVVGNRLFQVGDDAIAFVSYISDGNICTRFTATGNSIYQGAARGIAVVGGSVGSIVGNSINATSAANIYVAQESGTYNTYGITDVTVEGNTCLNATTYGTISTTHAAIHINNVTAAYPIDGVSIVGNHIRTPAYQFIYVDGVSTSVTNINIADNKCFGPSGVASQVGVLLGGNATFVNFHGNYIYKANDQGVQAYTPVGWIHDNEIIYPNQSSGAARWGIQKAGGAANIWNNFVLPDGAKTALSGNVSATPTAAAVAGASNAGTSPPAPVVVANSNDQNGAISFGTGSSAVGTGAYVTVTFASAYPVAPKVQVAAQNAATAVKQPYVLTIGTTSFQIGLGTAGALSQGNTIYNVNFTVEAQ